MIQVTALLIALFAGLLPVATDVQAIDSEVQVITPFFAMPLPADASGQDDRKGATITDVLRTGRKPMVILVTGARFASLLVGADRNGFGTLVPLPIQAYSLHLLGGVGGTLWIGGYSNPYRAVDGRHTSAYVAKLDHLGKMIWEREYGGRTERRIQSMASLPSGDIVDSATDTHKTWIVRISSDGGIVWERTVGAGKGSAIAVDGDLIVLAAIDGGSDENGYRDDVSAWSFNMEGQLLGHWTVRQAINRNESEYAEDVQIIQSSGALYILSKWGQFLPLHPLDVARFDLRVGVIWHRALLETVGGEGNRAHTCSLAIAALSNGEIAIACRSSANEMTLFRLEAATADLSNAKFRFSALPKHCDESWSPTSLALEESPGSVWLFGSPRSTDDQPCGWIAEIPIPATKH